MNAVTVELVAKIAYWPNMKNTTSADTYRLNSDGQFVNWRGDTWEMGVGENMATPASTSKVYRCPVCEQEYEVPDCLFSGDYHLPHLHDAEAVLSDGRQYTTASVTALHTSFGGGMATAVQENRVAGYVADLY